MYLFFALSISWAFSPAYEQLLERYVDAYGCVDYKSWKKDPHYPQFVQELRKHTPQDNIAYWINIYNAYTIHIVVEHYPITSIREIQNGAVWSNYELSLPFQNRTLDNIEHKKLRPLGDARIHAALSCASRGCPPLWNKIYSPHTIHEELDKAMFRWLDFNALHKTKGEYQLSQIFSWYQEDFYPSPQDYVQKWRKDIALPKKPSFFTYDWRLNDCTTSPSP